MKGGKSLQFPSTSLPLLPSSYDLLILWPTVGEITRQLTISDEKVKMFEPQISSLEATIRAQREEDMKIKRLGTSAIGQQGEGSLDDHWRDE
ncbi:MAG: hypothetical protein ACFFEK_02260 [Candidatus Thorarchaeota archaeon]